MKLTFNMSLLILITLSLIPSIGFSEEFTDLPDLHAIKMKHQEQQKHIGKPLSLDLNTFKVSQSGIDAMIRMGIDTDDLSQLGSGDIVGNGSGKAAADFNYTYKKLHKFISDCISTYSCMVNDRQRSVLNKIIRILLIWISSIIIPASY
mgnify:CR=1 FL=1|jgi:hypothetical protein